MPHPAAAPRPSPVSSTTPPRMLPYAEGRFAAGQAPQRTSPQGDPPWNG
ncbi:hypothetical protein [Paracidovorax avenae]|nr:hypothetical protein [Paracidovorax avenae]